MPTAIVTLPDGKRARVSFTDQDQLDSTVSDLVAEHGPKFGQYDPRTGQTRGVTDVVTEAIGEPALKFATGAAGAAVGGVRGVWDLVSGQGVDKAAADIAESEKALTRNPKTKVGKATTGVAEVPFELLGKGADIAGRKTAEVTGSPALGAAVNTGIQAAPGLLLGRLRAGGTAAGDAVAGEGAPPRSSPDLRAEGAPRQAPSQVGEATPGQGPVPRGTPPGPGAAPQAPGAVRAGGGTQAPPEAASAPPGPAPSPRGPVTGGGQQAAATPSARAQTYAGTLGLDWTRLGPGTRKALETIAQDATALDRLNPDAVRRQAHLESLRIPVRATRGQLERDPVQLRREALASNTTEGQPIRDIDIGANRDLQANLEVLRGRVGGKRGSMGEGLTEGGEPNPTSVRAPTKTPTQVGEAAQTAAREKAKWSKKGYQALYKLAEKTEPDAEAGIKPITDLFAENPTIQDIGWVKSWLSKAQAAKTEKAAGGEPDLSKFPLKELYDLRKRATKNMAGGGTEGHHAAQVRDAVDAAMQEVPEGAKAWQRATDAFRKHQQEFKDQAIVGKLVNQKKGGADRALALEKTWNTVAGGPLEQIRQVKKTLLTGGTPQLRASGRAAWRDFRAETINRILEDARKVTSADETERAILTEAALRKSINRIPRENLEEILGKANVRELYNILRARRITTRSPVGGRTTQSGTVPNALVLFEKVLKHIPGGKYVLGAKHAITELGERGEMARTAQSAPVSPLEQAARDVEVSRPNYAAERRAAQYRALESSGPSLPGQAPQPLPIGAALKPPQQP